MLKVNIINFSLVCQSYRVSFSSCLISPKGWLCYLLFSLKKKPNKTKKHFGFLSHHLITFFKIIFKLCFKNLAKWSYLQKKNPSKKQIKLQILFPLLVYSLFYKSWTEEKIFLTKFEIKVFLPAWKWTSLTWHSKWNGSLYL